ncbi:MAG TPA: hypothetical protein VN667_18750 [Burkholderiales bacterium]|nr:hypothetical protein [Burkholderiales bacterium]
MEVSLQAATRKRGFRDRAAPAAEAARSGAVLWAGLVLLAGIAPPALSQGQSANVKSMVATLNSSGARKECVTLTPRQRLRYWYRAEAPVNFAIQYVTDKETLYPVKKDKSAIGSGSFQPKEAQDYCMVWTNLAKKPVNLSFEFARVDE